MEEILHHLHQQYDKGIFTTNSSVFFTSCRLVWTFTRPRPPSWARAELSLSCKSQPVFGFVWCLLPHDSLAIDEQDQVFMFRKIFGENLWVIDHGPICRACFNFVVILNLDWKTPTILQSNSNCTLQLSFLIVKVPLGSRIDCHLTYAFSFFLVLK